MDEMLSRREAAERLGVHYNTIRAWVRGGRLTEHRGTRNRQDVALYAVADVEAILQERASNVNLENAQRLLHGRDEVARVLSALEQRNAALEAEVRILRDDREELLKLLGGASAARA